MLRPAAQLFRTLLLGRKAKYGRNRSQQVATGRITTGRTGVDA